MRMQMQGHVYPVYQLQPDKALAAKMLQSMGETRDPDTVPPTYLIFLRGESHGVDLFKDLDIPRDRALHGGQRYEWFEPIDWDTVLEVTTTVRSITEKTTKSGMLWFADVEYDYVNAHTKRLALRELTRIIKRG
jgi:hypothetical protein